MFPIPANGVKDNVSYNTPFLSSIILNVLEFNTNVSGTIPFPIKSLFNSIIYILSLISNVYTPDILFYQKNYILFLYILNIDSFHLN